MLHATTLPTAPINKSLIHQKLELDLGPKNLNSVHLETRSSYSKFLQPILFFQDPEVAKKRILRTAAAPNWK